MTRATRRTRTESVRARRIRQLRDAFRDMPTFAPPCTPKREGQMRDESALGCSRPKCGVCHRDKKYKSKSRRVRGRVEARKATRTM